MAEQCELHSGIEQALKDIHERISENRADHQRMFEALVDIKSQIAHIRGRGVLVGSIGGAIMGFLTAMFGGKVS